MVTFTVDKYGRPGMPTFNIKKIRKLLKSGMAQIIRHHPFTVKLLYAEKLDTQPVEICLDTGDKHIGVSVKSEKHEFVHAQYDPLPDEKERHDDRRRYRRTRRNRLRYRKPRFDNRRKKPEGWLPPTVEHKKDLHVSIVMQYLKVCPIVSITAEAGTFDTQLLEAIESGRPAPKGSDYQTGPRCRLNTLRDAVFFRDGYKCLLCGSTKGPFAVHHICYWKGDHSDRMANLATLCTGRCHISSNHQKNGPLWGWKPKVRSMAGAAFMNTVRWKIVEDLKEKTGLPVHVTYGSMTKTMRKLYCISKTHANDAFVMGSFHPRHRQRETVYKKRRRNNRILEKFYDAKYMDVRDGKVKKGQELSCGRTKRCEPRHSEKDLRPFRGHKVSRGRRVVRKERYDIRPGTVLLYQGKRYRARGVHNKGTRVILDNGKSVAAGKVKALSFPGAWERIS